MKRNIIFGCLFLLCCSLVYSVPAAPSPVCKINADVAEVREVERKVNMRNESINVSMLNVSINNVSTKRDAGGRSCEEMYKPGSEQVLKALHGVSIADVEAGDVIEGVIQYSGDEFSHGIYLKDYNITNKADQSKDGDENINDTTGDESAESTDKEKSFFAGVWSWLVNLF